MESLTPAKAMTQTSDQINLFIYLMGQPITDLFPLNADSKAWEATTPFKVLGAAQPRNEPGSKGSNADALPNVQPRPVSHTKI